MSHLHGEVRASRIFEVLAQDQMSRFGFHRKGLKLLASSTGLSLDKLFHYELTFALEQILDEISSEAKHLLCFQEALGTLSLEYDRSDHRSCFLEKKLADLP